MFVCDGIVGLGVKGAMIKRTKADQVLLKHGQLLPSLSCT